MTVYVITSQETSEVVGVFNTENEVDVLAGVLQSFYNYEYPENEPEVVADFVAQWVEQGIECIKHFGFTYVVKILNDPTGFEDV